jgi:hypothetical protein
VNVVNGRDKTISHAKFARFAIKGQNLKSLRFLVDLAHFADLSERSERA